MTLTEQYAKAAKKYTPQSTHILFVAEAPPSSIDRYFYYENVTSNDWLWLALMKALYPSKWGTTLQERARKGDWLACFCSDGYLLIDALKEPTSCTARKRVSSIRASANAIITEIKAIQPKQIILIKASVHEALYQPLVNAGLPIVNEGALPFPASGHQPEFRSKLRQLIKAEELVLSSIDEK